MTTTSFSIAILAAGKGTRMYSDLPKVLHTLAGKPLVQHVIDTAIQLKANQIYLIYGHGADLIRSKLTDQPVNWVFQEKQEGTGHAVQQITPYVDDNEDILILYGDTPLVSLETLQQLLSAKPKGGIALLTAELPNPTGYGRIVRNQGEITAIIEDKDATEQQRAIKEINTGILVVSGKDLKHWLSQLESNNAQGELYLTDIIALAYQERKQIIAVHPTNLSEFEGVNNRQQLARLERVYQLKQAEKLLLEGVMIRDPARFDLRGELICGLDVVIDINVVIEGKVKLGDRVHIGAGCILKECTIDDDSIISPYSIIEGSQLAAGCTVGPFARLRPESRLDKRAHVGNFVELKKTYLGKESKSGHLAYLGDAEIGDRVNIGAGAIICNYDGINKHNTVIGDDVFIGSDSQLVAPLTIANGATVAAGTTVTKNVAENELVISRVPQKQIQGWKRPQKKSKK